MYAEVKVRFVLWGGRRYGGLVRIVECANRRSSYRGESLNMRKFKKKKHILIIDMESGIEEGEIITNKPHS